MFHSPGLPETSLFPAKISIFKARFWVREERKKKGRKEGRKEEREGREREGRERRKGKECERSQTRETPHFYIFQFYLFFMFSFFQFLIFAFFVFFCIFSISHPSPGPSGPLRPSPKHRFFRQNSYFKCTILGERRRKKEDRRKKKEKEEEEKRTRRPKQVSFHNRTHRIFSLFACVEPPHFDTCIHTYRQTNIQTYISYMLHKLATLGLSSFFFVWEVGFVLIRHSAVDVRRVNYGPCAKGLGCEGENVEKIGKVGERERALVVSVKCGKERDMARGWQLFWDTRMCNREPRVFEWWNVIMLFSMCCDTLCASVHAVWEGAIPICWRGRSCRQVSPRLLREPPACARVDCIVIFLQFPQTLVLFAVLFVDCEEWFKNIVESLPCVRRAISCFLFFAWATSGRWCNGCWAPSSFNVSIQCVEFRILSAFVATYEWFSKAISHVALCAPRSIQYLTKTFCTCSRCSIVQARMDGFRAFLGELFAAPL